MCMDRLLMLRINVAKKFLLGVGFFGATNTEHGYDGTAVADVAAYKWGWTAVNRTHAKWPRGKIDKKNQKETGKKLSNELVPSTYWAGHNSIFPLGPLERSFKRSNRNEQYITECAFPTRIP